MKKLVINSIARATLGLGVAVAMAGTAACGDNTDTRPGDTTTADTVGNDVAQADTTEPDDTSVPVDTVEPDDTSVPVDTVEPDDTSVPVDTSVPDDTSVPGDISGPTDTTQPGDTSNPPGPTCDTPTLATAPLDFYFDGVSFIYGLGVDREALRDLGFGGPEPDYFQVIVANTTGQFPLGTGDNTSLTTCKQCIAVGVDMDITGVPAATLFQTGGTLVVTGEPLSGRATLGLSNVTFAEYTVNNGIPSFVPNGRCARPPTQVLSRPFTTTCPTVNISGTTVVGIGSDFPADEYVYYGIGGSNLGFGNSGIDQIEVRFWSVGENNTITFGTGGNQLNNFLTAWMTPIVFADYESLTDAKVLLPRSGSVTITGTPFEGDASIRFNNLIVDENDLVDYGTNGAIASVPIANGVCYTLTGTMPAPQL